MQTTAIDKQGAFISIEVFGKLLRVQRGFSQQFEIHEAQAYTIQARSCHVVEPRLTSRARGLIRIATMSRVVV